MIAANFVQKDRKIVHLLIYRKYCVYIITKSSNFGTPLTCILIPSNVDQLRFFIHVTYVTRLTVHMHLLYIKAYC